VLLARALGGLTEDPHAALLLVSALSGGALVVTLFLLGRELAGREAGWLAAAFGASAPLFWFYGSVGLNYGPAGALSALTVLGCVRLCLGRAPLPAALLAGGALGVLGGFRPTDQLFLAPAYLWALAGAFRQPRGNRAAGWSAATCALLTVGWLAPNIGSAGGIAAYLAGIRSLEHVFGSSSVFRAGLPALSVAAYTHRRCLESAVGVGWIVAALGVGRWALGSGAFGRSGVRAFGDTSSARVRLLAALVIGPAFLFYLLGHFNSPGYALVYSGLVAALAAASGGRLLTDGRRLAAVVAAILAGNGLLFLYGAPWDGGRLGQRALSAVEIADHARYFRELREALPRLGPPGKVRILASWTSTEGLRVVQAAVPEYAGDAALAVAARPELPEPLGRLGFYRLMTPEEIRAEGRVVVCVVRTWEDPPHHRRLFGEALEFAPIGPGHAVMVLPALTVESPPGYREKATVKQQ